MKAVGEAALQYYRHQAKTRKPLRFGQFYINEYMPADTKWPELFYETDNAKAILMIAEQIEVVRLMDLARKKSDLDT